MQQNNIRFLFGTATCIFQTFAVISISLWVVCVYVCTLAMLVTWYLSVGRAVLQACAVHLIAATDWRSLLHEVRELLLPVMSNHHSSFLSLSIPFSLHPSPRLQRLALILLVLHYSVEFLFHTARLLHYHGKEEIATPG